MGSISIQARLILFGVILVAITLFLTCWILGCIIVPNAGMLKFGKTSIDWQFIPLFAGLICINLSYVWFVISGFRTYWLWGVAILIIPFFALAFFVCHPEQGKKPGYLWLAGALVLIFLIIFSKVI